MKLYSLIFILLFSSFLTAQENYSKVKIDLRGKEIKDLLRHDVQIDHGIYKVGKYFIGEFSQQEINGIKQSGFDYKVMIDDLKLDLHNHNTFLESRDVNRCGETINNNDYKTPENFHLGSMAGNLTYEEMLQSLDSMNTLYPDLITKREVIDTFLTHEGRPIYWYKISDFANTDEDEPEVLYTALHHAREPVSMMQMIFYMWYLLENYGQDDMVTFLVNNREMYFIPCINPDGYLYNEATNPEGSGYWRKNRRDNGNNTFGVDLNRNYGYEWGHDNSGSSPNPDDDTYRGPSGFSEPETQAIKYFCENHNFVIALNYHTYGNLLIHPWGYEAKLTQDSSIFKNLGKLMIAENNYFLGLGVEAVGYDVNGDSDDWMYGDTLSKNKIFSMTPEVGTGGFWPNIDLIIPQCKENILMNLTVAASLDPYMIYKDNSSNLLTEKSGMIPFYFTNGSLRQGNFDITIKGLGDEFISASFTQNISLNSFESTTIEFPFVLKDNVEDNTPIQFEISINNGMYHKIDTIEKKYVILEDNLITNCNDIEEWTSTNNGWTITDKDYYSADFCITDSPDGLYKPNNTNEITLNSKLFVPNKTNVILNFKAKWDIEKGYDWVAVMCSKGGSDFEPLCGDKTVIGNQYQLQNEPVFDGTQDHWVDVNMDLNDFAGDSVYIKFILVTDPYVNGDGFYFDDIKIISYGKSIINKTKELIGNEIVVIPNPANDFIKLIGIETDSKLVIENCIGKQIINKTVKNKEYEINTSNWKSGIYYYYIFKNDEKSKAKSFMVVD